MTLDNTRNATKLSRAANFTDFILAEFNTTQARDVAPNFKSTEDARIFEYGAGDLDKVYLRHLKEVTCKAPPAFILDKYKDKIDMGAFFVFSFQRYSIAHAFVSTVRTLTAEFNDVIAAHPGKPLAKLIDLNFAPMLNKKDAPIHLLGSLREWVAGYTGAQIMSLAARRNYPFEISHNVMMEIYNRFGAEIAEHFGVPVVPRENYAPNNIHRVFERLAQEIYHDNKAEILRNPEHIISENHGRPSAPRAYHQYE